MKKPTSGTALVNRYTKDTWEVTNEKSPRGGLYVIMRNVTGKKGKKGSTETFHLSNLGSCFNPVEP